MKKLALAIAVTALASMSVIAFASAGVVRNQEITGLQVTAVFAGVTYVHNYTLTDSNPCGDGTFTGTGAAGSVVPNEMISGTLAGQNITINGVYPPSYLPDPNYTWSYSGPLSGGSSFADTHGNIVPLSFKLTTTSFANHGAYVSSVGGGDDAAHSCIGMPVQAQS